MLNSEICKSISKACEDAGSLELNGVKLENPNPSILDIREFDFDVHLAMQPAGIAYYNSLKKEAARRVEESKKDFDRWKKKKMLATKRALSAKVSRPTKEDVEVHYTVNNEAEIIKWEKKIRQRQKTLDDIESWYEAWKQKSFGMRDFADSHADEYYTTDTITESTVEKANRRREGIKKIKEKIRSGRKDNSVD